jgi:hypothetical protein
MQTPILNLSFGPAAGSPEIPSSCRALHEARNNKHNNERKTGREPFISIHRIDYTYPFPVPVSLKPVVYIMEVW